MYEKGQKMVKFRRL